MRQACSTEYLPRGITLWWINVICGFPHFHVRGRGRWVQDLWNTINATMKVFVSVHVQMFTYPTTDIKRDLHLCRPLSNTKTINSSSTNQQILCDLHHCFSHLFSIIFVIYSRNRSGLFAFL